MVTKSVYHSSDRLSSAYLTPQQIEYGFGMRPMDDHVIELTHAGKHVAWFNAHAPIETIQDAADDLMRLEARRTK